MRAIVVGAGIGGVAAAVALQRVGWRVTVVERAPELGEVGAGLSVWPSTVAVLAGLGISGAEKASVMERPAGLRTPDGRWVVRASDLGAEVPAMIHRARLHDLITAEFGPAVTVRTGYRVDRVTQDATGATVNDELRADLVIAADGLRSTVRAALAPDHPGPRYSGYTAYRGIADLRLDDGGGETWGRGQRFGFGRMIDGRVYWYATANRPPGAPDELADFTGWHQPIPAILTATPKVLHNDIYDLATPLAPFAHGRIALLGDAAHAMTPNLGRGACSAIEDAGALGRQLAGSTDPVAGLRAYDAERRPVTTRLVKRSRALGRVGQWESPVLCTVRDGLFAAGAKVMALKQRTASASQSG